MLAGLPGAVQSIGVFVNEEPGKVREVCEAAGIGMAQLHGDETPEFCDALDMLAIKAVRLGSAEDLSGIENYNTWALLVDSKTKGYGGSGQRPDWDLAARAADCCRRLFLAGGLDPDNVAEGIRTVKPWAVDVASGVESEPGIKDHEKMRLFIEAVKNAT
jgi:phosphoribosylanthranilate isomerase